MSHKPLLAVSVDAHPLNMVTIILPLFLILNTIFHPDILPLLLQFEDPCQTTKVNNGSREIQITMENPASQKCVGLTVSHPTARVAYGPSGPYGLYDPTDHVDEGLRTECGLSSDLDEYIEADHVDTFGTCVRVYRHSYCSGDSIAMYPTYAVSSASGHPETKVVALNSPTQSVSPCFDNELSESFFRVNPSPSPSAISPLEFRKAEVVAGSGEYWVPDKVTVKELLGAGYFEFSEWGQNANGNGEALPPPGPSNGPIFQYQVGHWKSGKNARVEFIRAVILNPHRLKNRGQILVSQTNLMGVPSKYSPDDNDYVDYPDDFPSPPLHYTPLFTNPEIRIRESISVGKVIPSISTRNSSRFPGDSMGHFVSPRYVVQGENSDVGNVEIAPNLFWQSAYNRRTLTGVEDGVLQWMKDNPVEPELEIRIQVIYDDEDEMTDCENDDILCGKVIVTTRPRAFIYKVNCLGGNEEEVKHSYRKMYYLSNQ